VSEIDRPGSSHPANTAESSGNRRCDRVRGHRLRKNLGGRHRHARTHQPDDDAPPVSTPPRAGWSSARWRSRSPDRGRWVPGRPEEKIVGMTGPACAGRGGPQRTRRPPARPRRLGVAGVRQGEGGRGLTSRGSVWARARAVGAHGRGGRGVAHVFPGGFAAARRARHGFRRRRGPPGFLGGAGLLPRHVCPRGRAQLISSQLCSAARGRHPRGLEP
jgi:hypothetical protein